MWLSLYGSDYLNTSHSPAARATEDSITARVIALPTATEYGWKTRWQVETAEQLSHLNGRKILLNWYDAPPETLAIGQIWQLSVRLKPPHTVLNDGGFDYQRHLLANDIVAKGYVKDASSSQLLKQSYSLRGQISQAIRGQCHQLATCDLLLALMIADRGQISPARWQLFRDTGTTHLLAVSGLHVGLVFSAILLLFRGAERVFRFAPGWSKLGLWLALGGALFYAGLAGFGVPTQRAAAALMLIWWLKQRQLLWQPSEILVLLAAIVLVFQPYAVFGLSYWLSFAAVAALIFLHWRWRHLQFSRYRWLRWLGWFVLVQVWLTLALSPLTVSTWGGISLVSPLANLLLLPLVGLLVLPLLLLALLSYAVLPALFPYLLSLADRMLSPGIAWLEILSTLPAAYTRVQSAALLAVAGGILLVVLVVLLARVRSYCPETGDGVRTGKPLLSVCAVLAGACSFGLFTANAANPSSAWRLTVLDVGQGLAISIEHAGQVALYDTGNAFNSGFSYAERVILPYLQFHRFNTVDTLFISHDDADHAGGFSALTALIPVKRLVANLETAHPKQKPCVAGQHFQMGKLSFSVLHPARSVYSNNNDSCVIRVTDGQWSVLLTGDIEDTAERALLRSSTLLAADVLIVPHHGSASSSSEPFIDAVAPQYAVVSAGFLNRYRQPAQQVIQRYLDRGITLASTAVSGQVSFEFSGDAMVMSGLREDRRRRWFHPISGWNAADASLE